VRAIENVTSTAANMPDHPSTTAAPAGRQIVAFDVVVLLARTAHRLGETWVVGIVSLRYGEDTQQSAASGQSRPNCDVCVTSAHPSISDIIPRRRERRQGP
jgi:hypothetical protein